MRTGFLQPELISICNKFKPFTIVIGKEERTLTEIIFIGCRAIQATQGLKCAVLIIPPGAAFKKIKRIGFACDFLNVYELPVNFLEVLIHGFNASLDIVHVSRNINEQIKSFVAASIIKENLKSLNPSEHFIINKNIKEGIEKFAKENQEDLVLVTHRQHSFLQSLFRKSESMRLELLHISLL